MNHPDTFTEVSQSSWLERIKGALAGMLLGVLLVLASVPVLFWNEGRAVKTARSLDEGAAAVRSIHSDTVDPSNDGALVHVSGKATTSETLADATFGVSLNALRLERTVEMFQWREQRESRTEKKLGGGSETVTHYNYDTAWSKDVIDSSLFKQPSDHRNPDAMRVAGEVLRSTGAQARNVRLGAFALSPKQVANIRGAELLPLDAALIEHIPEPLSVNAATAGGWLYLGGRSAAPAVGDLRVRWQVVHPKVVSIVAMQRGDALTAYSTSNGRTIELVHTGAVAADAMFERAQTQNTVLTWVLRAVGVIMMIAGFALVFAPLATIGDVVPAIGNLIGAGTGLLAMALGAGLSLIVIALAWVFYRPLIGGALLVVALALIAAPKLIAARRTDIGRMPPPPPLNRVPPPPPRG